MLVVFILKLKKKSLSANPLHVYKAYKSHHLRCWHSADKKCGIQTLVVGWCCECEQTTRSVSYTSHQDKFNSAHSTEQVKRFVLKWDKLYWTWGTWRLLWQDLEITALCFLKTDDFMQGIFLPLREILNIELQVPKCICSKKWTCQFNFKREAVSAALALFVCILSADTNPHLRLRHFARLLCKVTYNQCYSTRRAAVITITVSSH